MLTIRPDQLQALTSAALKRMRSRYIDLLRESWPAECTEMGDEALQKLVEDGVATAAQFGIVSDQDVARYLNLTIAISPTFHEQAWAQAILQTPVAEPWMRVQNLVFAAQQELDAREGHAPMIGGA